MKNFFIALPLILVILAVGACEVSLWQECRAEHSRFYCVRTLHPSN